MPSIGDTLPVATDDDGFINPLINPEASNAAIAAVLGDNNNSPDWPVPEPIESDLVKLPGGLVLGDDEVITHARVRELTGADEEAIARASVSLNPFHFLNVLLECGVARIGDQPKSKTKELLKQMLVGDRDALIIGIRRATYGDTIEQEKWVCPECEGESDLSIPLDDIPVRKLDSPADAEFDVALRKGRTARVRLATGADQLGVFENLKLNLKERDSLLLARTVLSVTEANGTVNSLTGLAHGTVAAMNMVDRNKILRELADRQPGPRFSEVTFVHDICNKEVTVAVGIGEMFPDL
jgi:hypothetical protein